MYINPFVAGVIFTIMAEMIIFIASMFYHAIKNKKNK